MKEPSVIRVMRWFEKDPDDSLIGETELCHITIDELNEIFGAQPDDPKFYACHPVEPQHLKMLQPHTETFIDLTRYDYFVECDAVNTVTNNSDNK